MVVAGRVGENMVRIEGKELQMILATDESLGNCPKVIHSKERGDLTEVYHHKRHQVSKERRNSQASSP